MLGGSPLHYCTNGRIQPWAITATGEESNTHMLTLVSSRRAVFPLSVRPCASFRLSPR
jgi:hypothetical protein